MVSEQNQRFFLTPTYSYASNIKAGCVALPKINIHPSRLQIWNIIFKSESLSFKRVWTQVNFLLFLLNTKKWPWAQLWKERIFVTEVLRNWIAESFPRSMKLVTRNWKTEFLHRIQLEYTLDWFPPSSTSMISGRTSERVGSVKINI